MGDENSVLVCGTNELASAVAHRLMIAGHSVALHQALPPRTMRRRMAFSDAWFDGNCTLAGIEARKAERSSEFLAGLRSRMFIPLLTLPLPEILERWPWDIVVDARPPVERGSLRLPDLVDFSIGLGEGFCAGQSCDVVIDIGGRDPGAVLREGTVPAMRWFTGDDTFGDGTPQHSNTQGVFHTTKAIGDVVFEGDILGWVGVRPIPAPCGGLLRGIVRDGFTVADEAMEIADILPALDAKVSGIADRHSLIGRSVAFAIDAERNGWEPLQLRGPGSR